MYGVKVNDGAARRCSRGMHKTSDAAQEVKGLLLNIQHQGGEETRKKMN